MEGLENNSGADAPRPNPLPRTPSPQSKPLEFASTGGIPPWPLTLSPVGNRSPTTSEEDAQAEAILSAAREAGVDLFARSAAASPRHGGTTVPPSPSRADEPFALGFDRYGDPFVDSFPSVQMDMPAELLPDEPHLGALGQPSAAIATPFPYYEVRTAAEPEPFMDHERLFDQFLFGRIFWWALHGKSVEEMVRLGLLERGFPFGIGAEDDEMRVLEWERDQPGALPSLWDDVREGGRNYTSAEGMASNDAQVNLWWDFSFYGAEHYGWFEQWAWWQWEYPGLPIVWEYATLVEMREYNEDRRA